MRFTELDHNFCYDLYVESGNPPPLSPTIREESVRIESYEGIDYQGVGAFRIDLINLLGDLNHD